MSKIEEVRSAMVAAMKAKDKETKETLSALLAALKNKAIDKTRRPHRGRRGSGYYEGNQTDEGNIGNDTGGSYRYSRGMPKTAGCSGAVRTENDG